MCLALTHVRACTLHRDRILQTSVQSYSRQINEECMHRLSFCHRYSSLACYEVARRFYPSRFVYDLLCFVVSLILCLAAYRRASVSLRARSVSTTSTSLFSPTATTKTENDAVYCVGQSIGVLSCDLSCVPCVFRRNTTGPALGHVFCSCNQNNSLRVFIVRGCKTSFTTHLPKKKTFFFFDVPCT